MFVSWQKVTIEEAVVWSLLGLLAKIKVSDVLPTHLPFRSTVELCRFCVLSLHKEAGGVRQYTR